MSFFRNLTQLLTGADQSQSTPKNKRTRRFRVDRLEARQLMDAGGLAELSEVQPVGSSAVAYVSYADLASVDSSDVNEQKAIGVEPLANEPVDVIAKNLNEIASNNFDHAVNLVNDLRQAWRGAEKLAVTLEQVDANVVAASISQWNPDLSIEVLNGLSTSKQGDVLASTNFRSRKLYELRNQIHTHAYALAMNNIAQRDFDYAVEILDKHFDAWEDTSRIHEVAQRTDSDVVATAMSKWNKKRRLKVLHGLSVSKQGDVLASQSFQSRRLYEIRNQVHTSAYAFAINKIAQRDFQNAVNILDRHFDVWKDVGRIRKVAERTDSDVVATAMSKWNKKRRLKVLHGLSVSKQGDVLSSQSFQSRRLYEIRNQVHTTAYAIAINQIAQRDFNYAVNILDRHFDVWKDVGRIRKVAERTDSDVVATAMSKWNKKRRLKVLHGLSVSKQGDVLSSQSFQSRRLYEIRNQVHTTAYAIAINQIAQRDFNYAVNILDRHFDVWKDVGRVRKVAQRTDSDVVATAMSKWNKKRRVRVLDGLSVSKQGDVLGSERFQNRKLYEVRNQVHVKAYAIAINKIAQRDFNYAVNILDRHFDVWKDVGRVRKVTEETNTAVVATAMSQWNKKRRLTVLNGLSVAKQGYVLGSKRFQSRKLYEIRNEIGTRAFAVAINNIARRDFNYAVKIMDGHFNIWKDAGRIRRVAEGTNTNVVATAMLKWNSKRQWELFRGLSDTKQAQIGEHIPFILSDGRLVVIGTNTADELVVSSSGRGTTVIRNNQSRQFFGVDRILIKGYAEMDRVVNKTNLPCEIHGGSGDDELLGGTGNDVLHGGPGNDLIAGRDGDDKIWGGKGEDRLSGGNGNDRIWGDDDQDNDLVDGGRGRDETYGEYGDVEANYENHFHEEGKRIDGSNSEFQASKETSDGKRYKKHFAQGSVEYYVDPVRQQVVVHLHARHKGRTGKTKFKAELILVDKYGKEIYSTPTVKKTVKGKWNRSSVDKHVYQVYSISQEVLARMSGGAITADRDRESLDEQISKKLQDAVDGHLKDFRQARNFIEDRVAPEHARRSSSPWAACPVNLVVMRRFRRHLGCEIRTIFW